VAFATGRGESLCTLECGAAYQGSQWPQYFSFYTLQFARRDILPAIFLYSGGSGKWVKDNTRSEAFVAPLPPPRIQSPENFSTAVLEEHVDSGADTTSTRKLGNLRETKRPISPSSDRELPDKEREKIELDAFRVRDAALPVYNPLKIYMDSSIVRAGQLYTHSSRVKELDSIIRKVTSRRLKGDDYSVFNVEDIIGLRYCTPRAVRPDQDSRYETAPQPFGDDLGERGGRRRRKLQNPGVT
jgi:hypothetical protein